MITKVILLFLFGTAMASDIFMKKLQSPYEVAVVPNYKSSGCPTAADWAPLICKFMQVNTDLFFKPSLLAPSTYIPPLVVQKCETPEIKVDLELPAHLEEKKPVLIPQPPELPPLTIPKFPVPVIVEEMSMGVNDEPSDNPEMPLIHIPAAPQLPALEIPVIPQIIEQTETYFIKEAIPEIDNNGIDEKPLVIPQPPTLPEFTMPKLPVDLEIPSGPVLPAKDLSVPPMSGEKPTEEPFLNEKGTPEIDYNLIKTETISQPPELPESVMPELPSIPTYFEKNPIAYSPVQAHFKPLAILPAAPKISPVRLPEFPVPVEVPFVPLIPPRDFSSPIVIVDQPIEESHLKEEIPKSDFKYERIEIPQPPELPAFVMPELPTLSFEQKPIETYYEPIAPLSAVPELIPLNVEIPSAPALPVMNLPSPPKFEEQPLTEINYNMMNRATITIPAPPELPAFVMPKLPLKFEEQRIKTYYEQLAPLPAAPELPADRFPGFPLNFEIPYAPVLPVMDLASPKKFEEKPFTEIDYHMLNRAPISIPAPPELPAFVIPKLPLNFEQEPIKTFYEPIAPLVAAPELPAASLPEFPLNFAIPSAPELPTMEFSSPPKFEEQPLTEIDYNKMNRAPISIPAPPELPAFVMPKLPLHFEQEPIKTYYEPLSPLPLAPELPAASLPEIPLNFAIPSAPELPTMEFSSPPKFEEQPLTEIDYNQMNRAPISIPAPPELPAFVMPKLPLHFEQEPIKTYYEPLAPLPVAPELPAASLPGFPLNFAFPSAPELPTMEFSSPLKYKEQLLTEIGNNMMNRAPISIPAPPELPAFEMLQIPVKVGQPSMVAPTPALPSPPKWSNFPALLHTFINKPCESLGKLEVKFSAIPYFAR